MCISIYSLRRADALNANPLVGSMGKRQPSTTEGRNSRNPAAHSKGYRVGRAGKCCQRNRTAEHSVGGNQLGSKHDDCTFEIIELEQKRARRSNLGFNFQILDQALELEHFRFGLLFTSLPGGGANFFCRQMPDPQIRLDPFHHSWTIRRQASPFQLD
jgi:hypothetical protein